MPLPFLGSCTPETVAAARRSHQQRKLQMLTSWRDAVERQLAALNASIATLEQQIKRDGSNQPQG